MLGAFLDAVKDPSKEAPPKWTKPEVQIVQGGRCKLVAAKYPKVRNVDDAGEEGEEEDEEEEEEEEEEAEETGGGGGGGSSGAKAEADPETYWKTSKKESKQSGFTRAIRKGRKNAVGSAATKHGRTAAEAEKEEQKEAEEKMKKNGLSKSIGLRAARLHAWLSHFAARGAPNCAPESYPSALGGFAFDLDSCLTVMPQRVVTACVGFPGEGVPFVDLAAASRFRTVVKFLADVGLVVRVERGQPGPAEGAAAAAAAGAAAASADAAKNAAAEAALTKATASKDTAETALIAASTALNLAEVNMRNAAAAGQDERANLGRTIVTGKTSAKNKAKEAFEKAKTAEEEAARALKRQRTGKDPMPTPSVKEQPPLSIEEALQRVYVVASPTVLVPELPEAEPKGTEEEGKEEEGNEGEGKEGEGKEGEGKEEETEETTPGLQIVGKQFNLAAAGREVNDEQLHKLWVALKGYKEVQQGSPLRKTKMARVKLFNSLICSASFWTPVGEITSGGRLGKWWENEQRRPPPEGGEPPPPAKKEQGRRWKTQGFVLGLLGLSFAFLM